MIKIFSRVLIAVTLTLSSPVRADMFGGDVVVLTKILANAIQQLLQLKQILDTGRDNLSLIRSINRGISDSLEIIRTLNPNIDPGIYKDWRKVDQAVRNLERIYGIVVDSPHTIVQSDLDRSAAEAIAKNNDIYKYSESIDKIGERIKAYSKSASPKGAQKLTAQSLGVALHVMNESLRAQATGLKLQAQSMAAANKQEKDRTRAIVNTSDSLKGMMKSYEPSFELPRFE